MRASPADLWQATNFDKLHFTGVEAATVYEPETRAAYLPSASPRCGASTPANAVLLSKYTFNYPVHSAVAEWRGTSRNT